MINNDEELLKFLEPYKQLIPWNCKKFEDVRNYLNNRFEDDIPYWRALYRIKNKINNDKELLNFLLKYERNIPWNSQNLYPVREYLDKRFIDSSSYQESLYRIKHNIEIKPLCPICNKPVKFVRQDYGFAKSCGDPSHAILNPEVQEKTKKTCLEKYGCEYTFQSENNKEKAKKTYLERYGVEYIMQSKEIQEKSKQTCLEKYGVEYAAQSEVVKEKYRETCLEKFGVDNTWKAKNVRDKIKQTMLEKYGVYSTFQIKAVMEKAILSRQTPEAWDKYKQTSLERYGVENYNQSIEAKEHFKEICLERYGVTNSFQIPEVQEKAIKARQTPEAWDKYKQTSLERYGVENWTQSSYGRKYLSNMVSSLEVQEKINESKRKNKSFNSSKPENETYKLLKEKFPNIIQSYRSEQYPFNCDFYIPELDLFIECNYHWTHGGKPYNENDLECKNKLNMWLEKSKDSKFYKNAIKTWTIRDINKRTIAKENSLNYIEFWNIKELKNWLNVFE